jgi:hypothetical protein
MDAIIHNFSTGLSTARVLAAGAVLALALVGVIAWRALEGRVAPFLVRWAALALLLGVVVLGYRSGHRGV